MANKLNLNTSNKQIKKLITEQLDCNPGLRRKELIELCVSFFDFNADDYKNRSSNSEVTLAKSRIGTVLTAMMHEGSIKENDIGILFLQNSVKSVLEYDDAVDYLLSILSVDKPLSKQYIYKLAEAEFRSPNDTSNNIRTLMGNVLVRLENEKRVIVSDAGYILPPTSHLPNTELGYYLNRSKTGDDLLDCYVNAIHIKGGEWFESYCVELIAKYYSDICSQTVTVANVMGGSRDGGIDGIIETTDSLGFRENTLLQMKNRRATMNEKDIREFYGAVCAQHGSRGIFITISKFHKDAQIFMDKIDNLIGLDGEKLFEIAKLCEFGVIKQNGRFILDDKLFLSKSM